MGRVILLFLLVTCVSSSSCVPGEQRLGPDRGCENDADCSGDESCVDGSCVDGGGGLLEDTPCTAESEAAACGVGAYCQDTGFCAVLPTCAGGEACPDGLMCNDATGSCVSAPSCEGCCTPGSCDDGRWCNGVEVCSPSSGQCSSGSPPCEGSLSVCDEASRTCLCDDSSDCTAPETCSGGACGCVPDCDGKQCGSDGCGGACGGCAAEDVCNEAGQCECQPSCTNRECGSDGCDGACGACDIGETCTSGGQCECVPDCDGKQCGDDGCGGSCGACASGACSANGQCNCVPDCAGRECGDDGCGGSCGPCTTGSCDASGTCGCTPDCAGLECGNDGCGGSCGVCGPHQACDTGGQCENTGDVCDVLLDTIALDEYQARSGYLTAGFDEEYEWDGRPARYLDNYPLAVPAGTSVVVDLRSTAFDPSLYVYDVAQGACSLVADDDDSGDGLNASLAITLGSGVYHVVATTYGQLATGAYTLATTTDLCGLTVASDVYDKCKDKVLANSCSNNPCLGSNEEFCCVTASCRSGYATGDELTVVTSSICP